MDAHALTPRRVAIARAPSANYGPLHLGRCHGPAFEAVTGLFRALGLDSGVSAREAWNPLGDLVAPGARVVVKPNWVLHENDSGAGLDCLITHTSVLDAILFFLGRARPAQVVLGDAPIQRCDFSRLVRDAGIDALVEHHQRCGLPLVLADFRARVMTVEHGRTTFRDRPERDGRCVAFDLGQQSFLEPVTEPGASFRVTSYHPKHLGLSHRPGTHRYLVARELVEADVVISVPKLKCHLKAGLTGALKNLVGISADKACLPHHRKGGSAVGGDCYPGFALTRHLCEAAYDVANAFERHTRLAHIARLPIRIYKHIGAALGWDTRVDGSWYGNDTVWRMCLDLHRLLTYGRPDGTLASTPQRSIFSIVDAIVAGEGDGPLSPTPVAAGFLTAGSNPAAVEWVNAVQMGFDPARIPLVREAMRSTGPLPLAGFDEDAIEVVGLGDAVRVADLCPTHARAFKPARGWQGHVELAHP
jgi:uncharacterized protein (DUF362 family)